MTRLATRPQPVPYLPPSQPPEATTARITIHLPRISWREGRPRFEPSPTLRARGFRGEDLRHEDGRWFSEGECLDWLRGTLEPKIALAKQQPTRRAAARVAGPPVYSLADLFRDLWKRPEFLQQQVSDGKRRRKPLSAKTVRWYKTMAEVVARFDPDVWAADATGMTAGQWAVFLEKLEAKHGLDTARAVRATLSMAYGRMRIRTRRGEQPMQDVKIPAPEPRLRVGEIAEMEHLITTADAMGRPEIGDAIMLGLLTGQRQGDRLALTGGQVVEGELLLKQSKRGAIVLVPLAPWMRARLAASAERRKGHKIEWPQLVIDENIQRPFAAEGSYYRHLFADVRDRAAGKERDEAETQRQGKPVYRYTGMESLKDFRDQDLRDTAVTWLANAGCDVIRIASITGHSLETIHQILKHYLARHPDQARAAIGSLVTWLEGKGFGRAKEAEA